MNFLRLFARNLRQGPYTEPFPFAPPAPTPKRLRGRIVFDPKICEGCLLCEKLCPSGAIRFTRTPEGMTFDCWHGTCVFCGTCEFYCPTKAVRQTNDWSLASPESEIFDLAEHGLIPKLACVECGGKGLDTAPNVAQVRPPLSAEETRSTARPLSEVPKQVPEDPGEETMTRLPVDIEAKLAAAAPHGVDYSSMTSPQGAVTAWCGLADSEDILGAGQLLLALGARMAMISALLLRAPEEEEEEEEEEESESDEAESQKPEKEVPKTFGGTPLDGTSFEIDYHFVLGGDFLTIVAYVPSGGSIPSLTPIFRAADWPEREIMEEYSIVVRGHPDPRRLFLDPAIDGAVLERLIPYSTLTNAASTKALWDKVLAASGGAS